jgi:O-antigen/teichoic acid export membrane protein
MNMAVAPQFARFWQRGDNRRLQRVATWNARVVAALSLPLAFGFVVTSEFLVVTLFGAAFAAGALPLAVLACGQAINAGMGSAGQLLNASGYERQTAIALAGAAFANITLNASLIPFWGMSGAALATSISFLLWNGYMVLTLWYNIGIDPTFISAARKSE